MVQSVTKQWTLRQTRSDPGWIFRKASRAIEWRLSQTHTPAEIQQVHDARSTLIHAGTVASPVIQPRTAASAATAPTIGEELMASHVNSDVKAYATRLSVELGIVEVRNCVGSIYSLPQHDRRGTAALRLASTWVRSKYLMPLPTSFDELRGEQPRPQHRTKQCQLELPHHRDRARASHFARHFLLVVVAAPLTRRRSFARQQ